jgi:hypothetical protein
MITTFYAVRDGTPRSALLAEVATILAGWGYRTLCIDWDGGRLTRHLRRWLEREPDCGLLELVHAFPAGDPDGYAVPVWVPRTDGRLRLLPWAGARDVDWAALHRDRDLGEFLEACAVGWRDGHDAVLIDAPAGSGVGPGICVAHLPDCLVALVGPDDLAAAPAVLERAERARDRLPYDRPRLLVVPTDVGPHPGPAARERFDEVFAGFFEEWADAGVPAGALARAVAVGPGPAGGTVRTLAALLAVDLGGTEALARAGGVADLVAHAAAGPVAAATDVSTVIDVRAMAVAALEDVLTAMLSRQEWADLERAVVAVSEAAAGDDVLALADGTAAVLELAAGKGATEPGATGIPAFLVPSVLRVIGLLRVAAPQVPYRTEDQ